MNSHMQKGVTIVLGILILSSAASRVLSAEIYKWKDKDGKISFSDSPPPAGVDTEVKTFKDEPPSTRRTYSPSRLSQPGSEMVNVRWAPAQMDCNRRLTAALTPSSLFALLNPSVWVVISSSSDIPASSPANLRMKNDLSLGSAVAISENRLLTNYHVIDGRPYVVVKQGERYEKAVIVSGHRETDRCILSVATAALRPVKGFRKFFNLVIGEAVYTIGSPQGLENTLGQGIISGKRELSDIRLIQTTAQISKGSSGGGLFDNFGNLIGMTTFKIADSDALNFAIAIEDFAQ
jgi:serine protease Do